MGINYTFERVEKKYLITDTKFDLLIKHIGPYMSVDKYGLHTICSIYYDTDKYDLVRNSIGKPKYKEKLRLRSYGVPGCNDSVFLEIKKKYDGVVFKRRISLTLDQAENYLEHGVRPEMNSQILNEIDYFLSFYKPEKKILIAYDRIALFGKDDENLRITLDAGIRSRTYDLDLSMGDYGKPMNGTGGYLMEIKTTCAMPLWLVHILSELKIYPVSFSKYGNVYIQDRAGKAFQELNEINKPSVLRTERRYSKCLQAS